MEIAKKIAKWVGIALLVLVIVDAIATYVPLPAPVKAFLKAPIAFVKGFFRGSSSAA